MGNCHGSRHYIHELRHPRRKRPSEKRLQRRLPRRHRHALQHSRRRPQHQPLVAGRLPTDNHHYGRDEYGDLARKTSQDYQYGIHGLGVAAGVVPFLESNDRISESSVATAIAAGLSSLILSCYRLAHMNEETIPNRKHVVEEELNKMQIHKPNKYVNLEKFAGIDVKIKDGLDIDFEEILTHFSTKNQSH